MPTEVWPVAMRSMERWRADLLSVSPSPILSHTERTSRQWIAYTDASPDGFGGVIFPADPSMRIITIAGRFSDPERIEALELRAVVYAARTLPAQLVPTPVHFYVDNTTAISAIRRTRSQIFTLNEITRALFAELLPKNYLPTVSYVQSEFNLADTPSRYYQRVRM